jgi:carboxyl-terminal processing protease
MLPISISQMKMRSKARLKSFRIILIAAPIFLAAMTVKDELFEVSKNLEIFNAVFKELNIYYVDDTKPGAMMKTGIDAMLKSLDPYTIYYPESRVEDAMFMQTGQYGGIGTLVNTIDGKITITEPYEGYAALKSGLMAGDVIISIAGKSVVGKKHDDVTDLLTGQPGTEVEIGYERPGTTGVSYVKIKREEIKIPDVPYYTLLADSTTGYIHLSGFTQSASQEVRAAFTELKKRQMKQLILDLRGNGGGLLREAINIVNMFVPKGTEIVRTKGKIDEWNKIYTALAEPIDTKMPIIVLVDRASASASEIVSGSLQDLDRAVVLGEESFGKGLVQQTKDLAYNSKLKLTVAKYYTPSGRCIQRLDYTHRDESTGEVKAVSDSLLKKFKTALGREVWEGRGITPDIEVDLGDDAHILQAMMERNIIFHYATQFRMQHEKIPLAEDFRLNDLEYKTFCDFVLSKNISYQTNTEKLFERLKKTAQEERYYEGSENEFSQLFTRIEPQTKKDLDKFRPQISEVLEGEIVSRFYYQTGRTKNYLAIDPVIRRSLEVFDREYAGVLTPGFRKK